MRGQALAVTLRAVFMGELELGRQKALVMKEALPGLLNGALGWAFKGGFRGIHRPKPVPCAFQGTSALKIGLNLSSL